MANPEHVERLKQGTPQWNKWRKQNREVRPGLSGANLSSVDLSFADLSGANLSHAKLMSAKFVGADLSYADLRNADLLSTDLCGAELVNADLSDANLTSADLSAANLDGVNLTRANLAGASLTSANLAEANLTSAELSETNLTGADLYGAELSGVKIYGTIFADLDLRTVKGLAKVVHLGPSPVALYTVQLPQDGIALLFLQGAGVPDEWINDYHAHMMSPLQYHSLFISYSSQDEALARQLHADLQRQGVRCWFAPEDMKIGDRFHARINEAIHVQDKLLLLLSEHALASSWVEVEVRVGMEKEQRQHCDVLFPIRLDDSVMETTQAWAALLRQSRHIGDFTNWRDSEAYQIAFDRLLRDLKKDIK